MKSLRHSMGRTGQQGVVLLLSMIILVVLLAAGAALVRSFDTSLFQAGNLAFKRDLMNQGERVVPQVVTALQTGALNTPLKRSSSLSTQNYSATVLPTNAQGIPNALLLTDAGFNAVVDATGAQVATAANDIAVAAQGVTIRYVIDRMCTTTGDEGALGDNCVASEPPTYAGSGGVQVPNPPRQVVFRISLRVDGPRNTQAFLQTTLAL